MVNALWEYLLVLHQLTNQHKKTLDPSNKYLKYTSIGFQMIATIGIGAGIGYFIDSKTNNQKHLYTAFITLIFVGIALYQVIKSVINDK